uniref:Disease resistance protein At4g27190-like leucine-rich repeats domain-containing protein n=1 Tax=Lactuca sativa TaxID=4236 RepID=A0A9R1XW64_LACSA|nr:hypothetical protein LSAT_V11C200052380 [Lactuca sativa]
MEIAYLQRPALLATIPAEMTSPTALEAARLTTATTPTHAPMRPATLSTPTAVLMFPRSRIQSLGPFARTHSYLNLIRLPLPDLLQINLPFSSPRNHIFQRLTVGSAHELPDVIPQHLMISGLLHLLIRDILRYKKSPLPELGGDLRHILKVISCDKLVNLFPDNPMSMLHHLEELEVENCGSIESLFNIDLDCAGAIGQEDNSSSLRNIEVENLGKLREVWRIKGGDNSRPLVHGFQAVESIRVRKCKRFRNVFTPTTTNFDLGHFWRFQ